MDEQLAIDEQKMSNKQLMGITNRSRRGKMKLLINHNIYIIITLLLYDTIVGSEKERWIRELWLDMSRCDKMEVLNNYNIYFSFILMGTGNN